MADEVARFDGEPRCEGHIPKCQACSEMATFKSGPVRYCSFHAVGNGAEPIEVSLDLTDEVVLKAAVKAVKEARRA